MFRFEDFRKFCNFSLFSNYLLIETSKELQLALRPTILSFSSVTQNANGEIPQRLHKLFSLEERLEMFHLPKAHHEEDSGLCNRPVKYTFVGALAGLTEALFAIALIILFLGDLLDLIQELTDSQLQLCELLLLCDVCVIDGMLSDLNVKMNAKLRSAKPGC